MNEKQFNSICRMLTAIIFQLAVIMILTVIGLHK